LQPTTIVVADIEAIRLRQFAQRGFEQPTAPPTSLLSSESARNGFADNTRTRVLGSDTSASRRLRVFVLAASIAAEAAALAAA
jgi:hypothetical protein